MATTRRQRRQRLTLRTEPLEDRRLLEVGPFPGALRPVEPLGSLAYEAQASAEISVAGDVDRYSVDMAAGQTVSFRVRGEGNVAPTVKLFGPAGDLRGSNGSYGGRWGAVDAISTGAGGVFTAEIASDAGTTGKYYVELLINATWEWESIEGSNDLPGTAENQSYAFVPLAPTTAERLTYIGSVKGGRTDLYKITVSDGQPLGLAAESLSGSGLALALCDRDGNVLASGVPAENADLAIGTFRDPADGRPATYLARVSATSDSTYSLLVVRGASLEVENVLPNPQPLVAGDTVLGHGESGLGPERLVERQHIESSSRNAGYFGDSVAMDGQFAFVGARSELQGSYTSGAVYVYRTTGSTWGQPEILVPPDRQNSSNFGGAVAVDGDLALVGASAYDGELPNTGAVYAYRFDGSHWIPDGKLTPSGAVQSANFGSSVALDGGRAIVAASGVDKAFIYRRVGGNWSLEQSIAPPPSFTSGDFGSEVRIDGTRAFIAASSVSPDSRGRVYVYQFNGTTWTLAQELAAPDSDNYDRFGAALAVEGNRLVVGAPRAGDSPTYEGRVYAYEHNGASWQLKQTLINGELLDYFGEALDVDGGELVVGASNVDQGSLYSVGAAYRYRYGAGQWLLQEKITASTPTVLGDFGSAMAIDGGKAIIGSPGEDTPQASNAGGLYVYAMGRPVMPGIDSYLVHAEPGQVVGASVAVLRPPTAGLANGLEPQVNIYLNGTRVASSGNSVVDGWDRSVSHTVAATGNYEIRLENGLSKGEYVLQTSLAEPGRIEGRVWLDADESGQWNVGESPAAGVNVFLDANTNGVADPGEPYAWTDAGGRYRLLDVKPGRHVVTQLLSEGYRSSYPAAGSTSVLVGSGQNVQDIDFGRYVFTTAISGAVKQDDNGSVSTGDPALAGRTVFLDNNGNGQLDSGEPSTISASDGSFRFEPLSAGTYLVAQLLPQGWEQTAPSATTHVSVTVGRGYEPQMVLLGSRLRQGQIIGRLWNDLNSNGIHDDGEPGKANHGVYIDTNANGLGEAGERFTRTDAEGIYTFSGLPAGTYHLMVNPTLGWAQTSPGVRHRTVELAQGQTAAGIDFGVNSLVGEIRGEIWRDADKDGARDANETPYEGQIVFLDSNANGALDDGERQAQSNGAGVYTFTNIAPGQYTIAAQFVHQWTSTSPSGGVQAIAVEAGKTSTAAAVGVTNTLGELTGRIWQDADRDGQWDASEAPLPGATVFLDTNGSGVLDSGEMAAITGVNGAYVFHELPAGDYRVVQQLAPSWEQTSPRGNAARALAATYNHFNLAERNELSGDGRFIAYEAQNGGVYLHDRASASNVRVSPANTFGKVLDISADGQLVVYRSASNNIVPGDTDGRDDVFVWNRLTGNTARVSTAPEGGQPNGRSFDASISGDGRYVAFASVASNLVSDDTNGASDVFLLDRTTGAIRCISKAASGTQSNGVSDQPAISRDGRYITFRSLATNLVGGDTNGYADIFVVDQTTGEVDRVSISGSNQANRDSANPAISDDGRFVVYDSAASNIVSGANTSRNVFVFDRLGRTVELVNATWNGTRADGRSEYADISGDGRFVVFQSEADNLLPYEMMSYDNAFLRDRQTGQTRLLTWEYRYDRDAGHGDWPVISGDGSYIAFESYQSRIDPSTPLTWSTSIFGVNNPVLNLRQTHLASLGAGEAKGALDFGARMAQYDWGDAPESYSTTGAAGGAVHGISPGFYLGSGIDGEGDGQPSPDASADDASGADDGITFLGPLMPGASTTVQIRNSGRGFLDGWIDFNADGRFSDAQERVVAHRQIFGTPPESLVIKVPATAVGTKTTIARFRFTSTGIDTPDGPAYDGEVEDYQVVIQPNVFAGTAGDDKYEFRTTGTVHTVTLNGVATNYDAATMNVFRFAGGGGRDSVVVYGGAGDETATLGESYGTVKGTGYSLDIKEMEDIRVLAGAGASQTAVIENTPGDDRFYGNALPGMSYMAYPNGSQTRVYGFSSVEARAIAGNGDVDGAWLYGSKGDDIYTGSDANGSLALSGGTSVAAKGFDRLYVDASQGGTDAATLTGSAGNDRFYATPAAGYIWYPGGSLNMASGFDQLEALAGAGSDTAILFDSAGNDVLDARQYSTRLEGPLTGGRYQNTATAFDAVYVYASAGGSDEAKFTDGAGSDRFIAARDSYLAYEQGELVVAAGFTSVEATAAEGVDRAWFNDTSGDDVFSSYGGFALMQSYGSAAYSRRTEGYEIVYATSAAGGYDRAELTDSPGNDTLVAQAEKVQLRYQDGREQWAYGFDEVTARAILGSGDIDKAYLHDTAAGSEIYTASRESSSMTRRPGSAWMFLNTAAGFDHVYAYATPNATTLDTATIADSALDDMIYGYGKANTAYIRYGDSTGTTNTATAFDRVAFQTLGGGADTATLVDSPGDDTFNGDDDWAELTNTLGAYYFRIDGLGSTDRVLLRKDNGGTDSDRHAASIDYLFSKVGDWG